MNQAFHLFQLQKLDSQIDAVDARIAAISSELQNDAALLTAQQNNLEKQNTLQQLNSVQKKLEEEIQAKRIKSQTSTSSLYGGKIQSPKELRDLEAEIASLNRSVAELEDELLEVMFKVDIAQSEGQASSTALQTVQAQSISGKAGLVGEQSQLQKQKERMLVEKEAAVSAISPEWVLEYEQLRKTRRGIAVASVLDGACSGCGATLAPAIWQAARSAQKVTNCPTCGRILYAG